MGLVVAPSLVLSVVEPSRHLLLPRQKDSTVGVLRQVRHWHRRDCSLRAALLFLALLLLAAGIPAAGVASDTGTAAWVPPGQPPQEANQVAEKNYYGTKLLEP